MAMMSESCSVCSAVFDVQFRYQMEERDNGFLFFCTTACQQKSLTGDQTGGVNCDACSKRFKPELVSQVVRTRQGRKYACSEACKMQLSHEEAGMRLSAFVAPERLDSTTEAGRALHYADLGAETKVPSAVVESKPAGAPLQSALSAPLTTANAPVLPFPQRPTDLPPASPLPAAVANPTATASISAIWGVKEPAVPTTTSGATFASPYAPSSATNDSYSPAVAIDGRKPFAAPRRLAFFNHKGGTGKTTTSVSVAAGLASRGYKVLLVDTDSQGNVGVSLGVKTEKSLYHVLVMGIKPQQAAVNVRPNLDLIVANETLAAAELYLAGRQNRDRVLRERLGVASADYDVVLVDCSPSLSLMNQNALVFADGILCPVACDFLSLVGVRQVIKTVKNVNTLLRHPVSIYGVLPTFYDSRARICRDAVDTLRQHFDDRCFSPIRAATKVKEAPAQGRTLFEYAPDSYAAHDYMRVVDRLIDGKIQGIPDQGVEESDVADAVAV